MKSEKKKSLFASFQAWDDDVNDHLLNIVLVFEEDFSISCADDIRTIEGIIQKKGRWGLPEFIAVTLLNFQWLD